MGGLLRYRVSTARLNAARWAGVESFRDVTERSRDELSSGRVCIAYQHKETRANLQGVAGDLTEICRRADGEELLRVTCTSGEKDSG